MEWLGGNFFHLQRSGPLLRLLRGWSDNIFQIGKVREPLLFGIGNTFRQNGVHFGLVNEFRIRRNFFRGEDREAHYANQRYKQKMCQLSLSQSKKHTNIGEN
ncbi:hypothetical protein [Leptospira fluminis]|uniref:hypothetical protein n=1 Tax=Leptospira fluminis TaxID=2484979 RepID=UPI001AEFE1F6|nr:hypothetical protein [Leptospira fluminis]